MSTDTLDKTYSPEALFVNSCSGDGCPCPPSPISWFNYPGIGYIAGYAIDFVTGDPLENVTVWIVGPETGDNSVALTDALGRFQVGPFDSGEGYLIFAEKTGYSNLVSPSISLTAGSWSVLKLVRGGLVRGSVTGPGGEPLNGAAIYLTQDIPGVGGNVGETDAEGHFCICSLDLGPATEPGPTSYTLLVQHDQCSDFTTEISISPYYSEGDATICDISLGPRGVVSGSVSANGVLLTDAVVWTSEVLDGLSPDESITYTDGEGRYALSLCSPGRYLISALGEMTDSLTFEVTVVPDGTVTLNFDLPLVSSDSSSSSSI